MNEAKRCNDLSGKEWLQNSFSIWRNLSKTCSVFGVYTVWVKGQIEMTETVTGAGKNGNIPLLIPFRYAKSLLKPLPEATVLYLILLTESVPLQ